MPNILQRYPEIRDYLDESDDYENSAVEVKQGDDRLLIVTQNGVDGQQLLFKWTGSQFEYWDNETIIDTQAALPSLAMASPAQLEATVVHCGPSSGADHKKVHDYVVSQVNVFDSSAGPDGGNLACVWTVRNLVKAALNRWITKTDGTTAFAQELRGCFGGGSQADDVPPGGLVISPSQNIPGSKNRNIGHVGFLGEGAGGARLIYSNSSAHKRLEQNYTVASWTAKYGGKKGLLVLFFALPIKSVVPVS